MAKSLINELVRPDIRYRFSRGPREVRTVQEAVRDGANCIAIAHLAIDSLFGVKLPPEKHCLEMATDTDTFATVTDLTDLQAGDLHWFGVDVPDAILRDFVPEYDGHYLLNWRDSPINHVAIFTGEMEGDEPLLLHASPTDGTTAVWPLSEFAAHERYAKLHRVSRLVGPVARGRAT